MRLRPHSRTSSLARARGRIRRSGSRHFTRARLLPSARGSRDSSPANTSALATGRSTNSSSAPEALSLWIERLASAPGRRRRPARRGNSRRSRRGSRHHPKPPGSTGSRSPIGSKRYESRWRLSRGWRVRRSPRRSASASCCACSRCRAAASSRAICARARTSRGPGTPGTDGRSRPSRVASPWRSVAEATAVTLAERDRAAAAAPSREAFARRADTPFVVAGGERRTRGRSRDRPRLGRGSARRGLLPRPLRRGGDGSARAAGRRGRVPHGLGSRRDAAAAALARLRELRDRRPAPADGAARRDSRGRSGSPWGRSSSCPSGRARPAALAARCARRHAPAARPRRRRKTCAVGCELDPCAFRRAPRADLEACGSRAASRGERVSRPSLLEALRERVLLGDGAMGTEIQRAGLESGGCGEAWNLDHPERVLGHPAPLRRGRLRRAALAHVRRAAGSC